MALSPVPRINFLNAMRGLAVGLVLWDHLVSYWPTATGFGYKPNVWAARWFFTPLGITQDGGFLGVGIFFLVSGFIVTRVAERERLSKFGLRRVLRIVPPLAVVVLVSAWWHPVGLPSNAGWKVHPQQHHAGQLRDGAQRPAGRRRVDPHHRGDLLHPRRAAGLAVPAASAVRARDRGGGRLVRADLPARPRPALVPVLGQCQLPAAAVRRSGHPLLGQRPDAAARRDFPPSLSCSGSGSGASCRSTRSSSSRTRAIPSPRCSRWSSSWSPCARPSRFGSDRFSRYVADRSYAIYLVHGLVGFDLGQLHSHHWPFTLCLIGALLVTLACAELSWWCRRTADRPLAHRLTRRRRSATS